MDYFMSSALSTLVAHTKAFKPDAQQKLHFLSHSEGYLITFFSITQSHRPVDYIRWVEFSMTTVLGDKLTTQLNHISRWSRYNLCIGSYEKYILFMHQIVK